MIHVQNSVAVVLAGGKSTRMGRDKRWVALAGEALLHRSIRLMQQAFKYVVVSANDAPIDMPAGVTVIPDLIEGLGPLGGIHACLKALEQRPERGTKIFVLACDTPFPSRALIDYMDSCDPSAAVVLPESPRGLEPLHAYYTLDCLPVIERTISRGNSQVISFFPEVATRKISGDELAGIPGSELAFLNINREPDLIRAMDVLGSGWSF